MRSIYRFLSDDQATTAVEYAVMLAMIILVCLGAIGTIGAQNGSSWGNIKTQINNYMGS